MVGGKPRRGRQDFPKAVRLRSSREFTQVYGTRLYAADASLVINARRRPESSAAPGPARLGLSVGKVVGNAPVRNRWKRLIREAFRLNQSRMPAGFDFVVRPRKGAAADFRQIESSLMALVRRIRQRQQWADRPNKGKPSGETPPT